MKRMKKYLADSYVRYDENKPSLLELHDVLTHDLAFLHLNRKNSYHFIKTVPADHHVIMIGNKTYRIRLEPTNEAAE